MSFNLGFRLVDKVQNKDGKYPLHFKTNRESIGNIDVNSVSEDDKEYTFLDSKTDSMSCKVHVAIRDKNTGCWPFNEGIMLHYDSASDTIKFADIEMTLLENLTIEIKPVGEKMFDFILTRQ
ncbi:hypothetical protein SGGMMB4_04113 [Sodalis glossinidius str. 'morsitans']|uniref:Calcium-dependent cell adhesion molecule 1 membrane-binding domain-containing protein n=1 Tax=Sodalis glossinidius (strain morsitans) TaxID=343509 RepID=A0A193QLY7_SODGM|nr:hypothetical protein [Sodalis glossinidius]CRL45935.1 hypothetical protein SGGMMB4_04113 [Sodalis glossinidius str. 'morsitans']